MERKDKIRNAILSRHKSGDIVETKRIITIVQASYPEIPKGSILPSDFCDNHTNEDPFSGKYHIFEKVARGMYKVK